MYVRGDQIFEALGRAEVGTVSEATTDFFNKTIIMELTELTVPTEEELETFEEDSEQTRNRMIARKERELLEDYTQFLRETELTRVGATINDEILDLILGRDEFNTIDIEQSLEESAAADASAEEPAAEEDAAEEEAPAEDSAE